MTLAVAGGVGHNDDVLPAIKLTYCCPPIAYVATPPLFGIPALTRNTSAPSAASSAKKSPGSSAVNNNPADVAVTAACDGVKDYMAAAIGP